MIIFTYGIFHSIAPVELIGWPAGHRLLDHRFHPWYHVMGTNERRFFGIKNNPRSVRFRELEGAMVAYGFPLKRTSGSHHISPRAGIPQPLNIQDVRGMAKPYQVRQFLALVEKYELRIL
jgi:hypothetical protein